MVVQAVNTGSPMGSALPSKRDLESKSEWEARILRERNTDILDAMASYARDKKFIVPNWVMELCENLDRLGATDESLFRVTRAFKEKSQKGERISARRVENLATLVYKLKLANP